MSWLLQLLGRGNAQNCQPAPTPAQPPSEPPASMTQVMVEETIMAVAKWLVNVVNRALDTKSAPKQPEPAPAATAGPAPVSSDSGNAATSPPTPAMGDVPPGTVDQLLVKFGGLIEEACDRTQTLALIENRLQGVETAIRATQAWEDSIQLLSQAVVRLDSRLARVEQTLAPVDLSTLPEALATVSKNKAHLQQWVQTSNEQLEALNVRLSALEATVGHLQGHAPPEADDSLRPIESTAETEVLEERIAQLEKMVTRLSIVPRVVESNYRAIATLQNHLKKLDKVPAANGHKSPD